MTNKRTTARALFARLRRTLLILLIAGGVPGAGAMAQTLVHLPADTGQMPARLIENSHRPAGTAGQVPGAALSEPALSPFGMDCAPGIRVSATEGGFLDTVISAPCKLGQTVQVGHDALTFALSLSNTGQARLRIPAVVRDGAVAVTFADGTILTAAAPVSGIGTLRRMVFAHDGPADHVFLKASGPERRKIDREAFATATGTVSSLTAPMGHGTVRLSLLVEVTPANCGQPLNAHVIEQAGAGAAVQKTQLSLNLPGCERVGDVLELKNAVPDLRLARY